MVCSVLVCHSEQEIGNTSFFYLPRKETVDFPTFVRILAHFRPTETNRTRDGTQQEPANSRTGKLKC